MAEPTAAPDPARVRHRVLVVDDDEPFVRSIAEGLEDVDIEATACSDPRTALVLARERPFDVAVVDLIMPEMDGLELAHALRKDHPRTEVILLTGHADLPSAIEGLRQGLFDYLQKHPLQAARLRQAVRAAIARRAGGSRAG